MKPVGSSHDHPVRWRAAGWDVLLVLSLTAGGPAASAEHSSAPRVVEGDAQAVSIAFSEGAGRAVRLRADCVIPRPQPVVWNVLSDYDHLAEFVPTMTESRVIRVEPSAKMLRQQGRVGVFFIGRSYTVTFRVEETPMRSIRFEAIAGDFKRFKGRWSLESQSQGTAVRYEAEVEPAFFIPRWMMRLVQRRLTLRNIEAVIHRCLALSPPST